jgi:hypothetical protein
MAIDPKTGLEMETVKVTPEKVTIGGAEPTPPITSPTGLAYSIDNKPTEYTYDYCILTTSRIASSI